MSRFHLAYGWVVAVRAASCDVFWFFLPYILSRVPLLLSLLRFDQRAYRNAESNSSFCMQVSGNFVMSRAGADGPTPHSTTRRTY
jgi:hypothetical protein